MRRGGGGVAGRWERPSSEGCDVVRRLERFRFCGGGCGGFVVEFTKTCRDGEDPIRWNLKTDPSTGRRCSTTNPGGVVNRGVHVGYSEPGRLAPSLDPKGSAGPYFHLHLHSDGRTTGGTKRTSWLSGGAVGVPKWL